MLIKSIASGIADYVGNELNKNRQDVDVIRYGLEILLGGIVKAIIVLGIAALFDVVPYLLAGVCTSGALRLLSGGVHCQTYARCLVVGTVVNLLNAKLAVFLGPLLTKNILMFLIIAAAILGFVWIEKWAPADSASKPIRRPEKKEKLKKISLVFAVSWATLLLTLIFLLGGTPEQFSLIIASVGGFIIQIFSLTPAGYRLVNRIDCFLGRLSL